MYPEDRIQPLIWAVRIIYMIPLSVVHLAVYTGRFIRRWYLAILAEAWPTTDARVTSCYEIDENQSALSRNGWDDDRARATYHPRYAIAIQYSYRANGELYGGTYFLPETHVSGSRASKAEQEWKDRKIVVRYNPSRPEQSVFLIQDGAPGKPHVPRLLSYRPYVTDLSLR